MELKLSAASKVALGIPDNADFSAIDTAIADLKAKADKVEPLEAKLTAAETALAAEKKAQATTKVDTLLATAKNEKKITEAAAVKFKADYAENPDGLKAILDTLTPMVSVVGQLNVDTNASEELKALAAITYKELDKGGLLPKLKALNLEVFKAKFKEHYGTDYVGA